MKSTDNVLSLWETQSENLSELHTRICNLFERDILQLKEVIPALCRILRADDRDIKSDLSEPSEFLFPHGSEFIGHFEAPPTDILPSCKKALNTLYQQLQTTEQALFFRGLIEQLPYSKEEWNEILFGGTEPLTKQAASQIAYQHNIYADEAYLHFSKLIPNARSSYFDSFSAVCEQVFNGLSEFCILPLENSKDGKLLYFYGLIEKYELKIAYICEVTSSDKEHSTTFGLCRRNIAYPRSPFTDPKIRLEFIFRQENEHPSVAEILSAAETYSLRLLRADCLPRSDDEILMGAPYPFDLSFESDASGQEENDLYAFLLFLNILSPSYLPIGLYCHI